MLFALGLAEGVARYRDHDVLLSLRLHSRGSSVPLSRQITGMEPTPNLLALVRKIPVRQGIDVTWFEVDPPDAARRPVDPVLQARYEEFERSEVYPPQSFYIWNHDAANAACGDKKYIFGKFPRHDVKAFENTDRSPYPAYRFPPNQTLPSGLVTNQFGFRGAPLAPRKDPGLIRIAFVGASTTQNVGTYGWSYPELAGNWLNVWLKQRQRPERVEVINAGREGLGSADIREIVKREVVPLRPDYVVYLEGANAVTAPAVKWPGGRAPSAAPVGEGGVRSWSSEASKYSALAKAVDPVIARASVRSLDEPRAATYELQLPSPEHVTSAELDAIFGDFFHLVFGNLDEVHRSLEDVDARLIVSSVIRLVHHGLRLDPVSQAVTYQQLTTMFRPFTYADMRRLVDLQNAAYGTFAADRGVDFIDVATGFPRDPDLFFDTFHLNQRGVRLHAWLAFLRLSAILDRDFDRLSARPAAAPAALVAFPEIVDARLPSCAP